jgi:hypothetical protein
LPEGRRAPKAARRGSLSASARLESSQSDFAEGVVGGKSCIVRAAMSSAFALALVGSLLLAVGLAYLWQSRRRRSMRRFRCTVCNRIVWGTDRPPVRNCKCGATSWQLEMIFQDAFTVRERLVVMDGPTKKKSRFRMESKDDFDHDSQRPSIAERVYDKREDLYRETILVDGRLKHQKEERLSEHRTDARPAGSDANKRK